MGLDKALAHVGGRRMIDHVVAALTTAGLQPIVAGHARPGIDAEFVADPAELGGPAAGLAGVMRTHPGRDIVLVGTDQPYLRPETVRNLLQIEGTFIAPIDGRRQTLCAVYRAAGAEVVDALLTADPTPSLQRLFANEGTDVDPRSWRAWGEDGRSWLSVDTPEALQAANAAWPDPPAGTIGA